MRIILALTLCLVLECAAQIFPVAGTAVDAQSGAPISGMRMTLTGTGSRDEMQVVTGSDGGFSFQVPQGKYRLSGVRPGASPQVFGRSGPRSSFGSAIITGPDQDTSRLVFRWFSTGAIVGTVTDDRGEPVEGALVQLIVSGVARGKKRTWSGGWQRTNDEGNYRFGPVPAGTYYVAVTGEPWYSARMPPDSSQAKGVPTPGYAPAYYPNATDVRAAGPLAVNQGGEARADFRLQTILGATIQVNCSDARARSGMLSILSDGIDGVQGFQRQLTFTGQSQRIPGVPPGRYTIRLTGTGDPPFTARKTIEVGSSDEVVNLTMQPPPSVSGKVTFKHPEMKPRGTLIALLVNEATGGSSARVIEPDGSVTWTSVGVGRYRPEISGADGFFVSQVSAEGGTLEDGVLDVMDGASIRLNLIASDETGRVKGLVVNGNKPAPGVLVILAPRMASTDPYEYRGFQTESDGSFDMQKIRAGDYILFAVEDTDFEFANPDALRPFLSSGLAIHLAAHAEYTERVHLSAPVPQKQVGSPQ